MEGTVNAQQDSLFKQWDKRYGGLLDDLMGSCIPTTDGGYLLGGAVYSGIGGDKTQDNWDTTYNTVDFWVVKIDQLGNKQWDKRFGGYSDDGDLYSLIQTTDGGYLLNGSSGSDIGGDKTQNCRGGADYWIVKIDASGNKEWDRRYGGLGDDINTTVKITPDGGYILAGYTWSPQGGDVSQPARGGVDYWVVKTDSAGNKQWDARFGGTDENFLAGLVPTNDGGYLLGGFSNSDSGGDKTQDNTVPNNANYWVVKIDSAGNKLWDKTFGSNSTDYFTALIKTADGGFLLGGYSYGTVGYDKTSPDCDSVPVNTDYWIIKIDSAGNKLWDKDYGGSANDELSTLALTNDGGFLLAGGSLSPASCQKTENNTAAGVTWIIKTDSAGNQQWDKNIFLNAGSSVANAFQIADGSYIIGAGTYAEVGYYKSQPAWDSSGDYWIVKFRDSIIVSGVNNISDGTQLTIYPNPFSSDLNINISQSNLRQATFTITNTLGQTVYNHTENNLSDNYTKMLDLRYLPNGGYLVEVVVDGERICREVVKQ